MIAALSEDPCSLSESCEWLPRLMLFLLLRRVVTSHAVSSRPPVAKSFSGIATPARNLTEQGCLVGTPPASGLSLTNRFLNDALALRSLVQDFSATVESPGHKRREKNCLGR